MNQLQSHFPTANFSCSRREALKRAGAGFGLLALTSLFKEEGLLLPSAWGEETSPINPLAPRLPHFSAKAKAVIWLFINGGPSQVDTWDYKPALAKWDGRSIREFDPTFKDTTGFFK